MKPFRALTAAIAAALLCVLLAPTTFALAAGTSTTSDPYGEKTPLNLPGEGASASDAHVGGSSGGGLARTFVGLAVVVAVIYGLTWVLRQMKKSSSADGPMGTGLSTEATLPLGPNRSVHLIRAGRELVLVGSAEHGIVPIRTYSEDEALDLGLIEEPLLRVGDVVDGDARELGGAPSTKVKLLMAGTLDRLRERTAR